MTAKVCLACKSPIKGRADKKFCNDACRNTYNSRSNNHYYSPLERNINSILRRNRRILEELLAPLEKKVLVIERYKLAEMGFQFDYVTEHYHRDNKEHYYYCYEYGYRPLGRDKVLAVRDNRKKYFIRENNLVVMKRVDH